MSDIELSMCVGDYDINRALLTGEVQPKGVRLVSFTEDSPNRHWRMARHEEFDVSEFAMAKVILLGSGGVIPRLVAIPAFPHRRFRHRCVYVRQDSKLEDLSQLSNKRIGLRSWQNSACLWVRGILQDFYGVDLSSVSWVAQDEEDLELPGKVPGVLTRPPAGESIFDLLEAGELDAVIYPETPRGVRDGTGRWRSLLRDPKAAEIAFYRETGIFPIMHTVVIRGDLLDSYPWLAVNVLDAFRRSKDAAFEHMRNPRSVSLAWLEVAQREQLEVLGPDPWDYRFASNAEQLGMLARWGYEQGLAAGIPDVSKLFAASTLDEAPSFVGK